MQLTLRSTCRIAEERMEFAFDLFDEEGYLREKFSREGTGVWGSETKRRLLPHLPAAHPDRRGVPRPRYRYESA